MRRVKIFLIFPKTSGASDSPANVTGHESMSKEDIVEYLRKEENEAIKTSVRR